MNIQYSGGSRSFAQEMRAVKMRNTVARPLDVNNDQLRSITRADPLTTTREVAEELNINHSMIIWHLKQIGKVIKLNKWVPHELTTNQKYMSF